MNKISINIVIIILSFITLSLSAQGVFKVQGKRTQIAYTSNAYSGEYLSFGKGTNAPFNGEWNIGKGD